MDFIPKFPKGPVFPPPFPPLPPPPPKIPKLPELEFYPPKIPWWWRWKLRPTVNILIVTDGSVQIGASNGFGVGKVIDTLENNPFYNWVDFKVTCVKRDGGVSTNLAATSHQYRHTGFRFNMAGFNLNDYDQVWCFGFNPDNFAQTDANITQAIKAPLNTAAELQTLQTWMDTQQGGVLAIGDHDYLGASMCFMIPRVRNMRKWTNAQGVPSIDGSDRKDTNQPSSYVGTIPFGAQGDDVPQPIEVIMKTSYFGGLFVDRAPHPILCGVDGVINVLPDHPHEGVTLGKRYDGAAAFATPVDTTQDLGYMGVVGTPEYPNSTTGGAKPEPEIIALGHPINNPIHMKNQNIVANASGTNDTTPFGLISVYDGEKAGIGRVAVDSTWHHWFNENLQGMETAGVPALSKIQNYYVNMAVWLSRKSLRSQMYTAYIWNSLVFAYDPMIFTRKPVWSLGLQAYDVIGRNAPQCLKREWIGIFVPNEFFEVAFVPDFPCLTCPPFEYFERAMLGGVLHELIPLVEKYRANETTVRQTLKEREVSASLIKGVKLGLSTFQKTLEASLKTTIEKSKKLGDIKLDLSEEQFTSPHHTINLRFVLDRVVLNSPILNALGKPDDLTLSMSVRANEVPLKGSPFAVKHERGGGLKPIEKGSLALVYAPGAEIFHDTVDEGENFHLELFLHSKRDKTNGVKIWELFFTELPEQWIGTYGPDYEALLHGKETVGVWLSVEHC